MSPHGDDAALTRWSLGLVPWTKGTTIAYPHCLDEHTVWSFSTDKGISVTKDGLCCLCNIPDELIPFS